MSAAALSGALIAGFALLAGAPAATSAETRRIISQGLTAPGGLLVDPASRIWVSDGLQGFCRLSEASGASPGRIEPTTCLGGTTTIRQRGPARPGAAALADPTPASPGSGDEVALIPDAAAGSAAVTRARWNPSSGTFIYLGTLTLFGGDLRPTAVTVGPDLNAYVVFERARSIVRIVDPTATQPTVRTVGFVAAGGARAVAAGGADSSGRVLLYIADGSSLTQYRPPASGRSGDAATVSYPLGAVAQLVFDPATATLFAGTATATASGGDTVKRVDTTTGRVSATWGTGFTRVGGLAVRGSFVLVADDPGLLASPAATGAGAVTEFTADVPPPTPVSQMHDFTGDGKADVVALDDAGRIWLYRGDGAGLWQGWQVAISDVQDTTAIITPGDWNGDAKPDLLRRDTGGRMLLHAGDGAGGFGAGAVIGIGWAPMTAIFGPGDWDGDGHADVLARDSSGGLWLYPGSGAGGWGVPRLIGNGWNPMTAILGPGDWDGDGSADVLARDSAGGLWLYPGSGTGGWGVPRLIGSGWSPMTAILGPGDWDGDNHVDVLARDTAGRLWLYPGNGLGGWGVPRQVGSGWQGMKIIA